MRKSVIVIVGLFIGVLWVTSLPAQVNSEQKPGQASERPTRARDAAKRFMGEIVSVDAAAKAFTARSGSVELTFDASLARVAPGIKWEELKAGDKIAVLYMEKDGKNVARAVGMPMAPRAGENKPAESGSVPEKK